MRDGLGAVQAILLLGGTSEIGLAIARALAAPRAASVILAGRDPERLEAAAAGLRTAGAGDVRILPFDALDTGGHEGFVEAAFAGPRDIDAVVMAVGLLGDQTAAERDAAAAREILETNFIGPASVLVPVAARLRAQGHGAVVLLSSVAAERPRRANFVYGAAKAGLDAFGRGLGEALRPDGVRVLVLRPGFVRTRMTAGLRPAPFSVDPEAVAAVAVDALRRGDEVAWVPAALRWVMLAARALPAPLFRRIQR